LNLSHHLLNFERIFILKYFSNAKLVQKSESGTSGSDSNSISTAIFICSPVTTDRDLVGVYAESMMTSLGDFMQLLIMIFLAFLLQ